VLSAISLFFMFFGSETRHMLNSWMFGFMFWTLVTMGCLGLTLLHHSIKSRWTLAPLRIFEAGSSWQMWVVIVICFLPVLLKLGDVYPWVYETKGDFILEQKAPYLNVPAFLIRFFFFVLFFAGISAGLRASTQRHDKSLDQKEWNLRANWGTPGLVFFFLTSTFFLTDLGMSLTPHWASTIYPLWLLIAAAQAALSLCVVLICTNAYTGPYKPIMSPLLTKDLGNMMFVLTMLWGYTSVSQLVIIWNGNLPEYASFYAHRSVGAQNSDGVLMWWNAIGAMTILGCFLVPFITLLSPRMKRYPERLAIIAGFICFMQVVNIHYIIGAAIWYPQNRTAIPDLYNILGFLTMGAIWFTVMLNQVRKAPLFPKYDTRLQEDKANAH
jgi:hypothetical protein